MAANSGNTLLTWEGYEGIRIPSSAQPSVRNQHLHMAFGKAWEQVYFSGVMPRHYSGNSLYVVWWFRMAVAIGGTTTWAAGIERHHVQFDLDANGFGQVQFAVVNVAPVAGRPVQAAIVLTSVDGLPQAGEHFRILFIRDGTNLTYDTANGDAEILGVELREV